MPAKASKLRAAAVLGSVAGIRTFGPWGVMAARGKVTNSRLRLALLTALAGELSADKHPAVPPRSDPPALAGRVLSGALAGRLLAGGQGAGAGATGAAVTTFVSERARALLGQRSSIPDPGLAVVEDVAALSIAGIVACPDDDGSDAGVAAISNSDPGGQAAAQRSPVAALGFGLLAAGAGTGATTSVQVAYLRATGRESSSTPERVARRLINHVPGKRVPRRRRGALNQAMTCSTARHGALRLACWHVRARSPSVRQSWALASARVYGASRSSSCRCSESRRRPGAGR